MRIPVGGQTRCTSCKYDEIGLLLAGADARPPSNSVERLEADVLVASRCARRALVGAVGLESPKYLLDRRPRLAGRAARSRGTHLVTWSEIEVGATKVFRTSAQVPVRIRCYDSTLRCRHLSGRAAAGGVRTIAP